MKLLLVSIKRLAFFIILYSVFFTIVYLFSFTDSYGIQCAFRPENKSGNPTFQDQKLNEEFDYYCLKLGLSIHILSFIGTGFCYYLAFKKTGRKSK